MAALTKIRLRSSSFMDTFRVSLSCTLFVALFVVVCFGNFLSGVAAESESEKSDHLAKWLAFARSKLPSTDYDQENKAVCLGKCATCHDHVESLIGNTMMENDLLWEEEEENNNNGAIFSLLRTSSNKQHYNSKSILKQSQCSAVSSDGASPAQYSKCFLADNCWRDRHYEQQLGGGSPLKTVTANYYQTTASGVSESASEQQQNQRPLANTRRISR